MSKQCFTWSELGEEWIGTLYTWSDVCILIQAAGGGGSRIFDLKPHKYVPPAQLAKERLDKKEYQKFIKLVCKINGIKTSEIKNRKQKGQVTVTIGEIQRLYEDVKKSITLKQIRREDI